MAASHSQAQSKEAKQENATQSPNTSKKPRSIYVKNPLIGIMAIAKEGDVDDMNAKKQDYLNIIFAINHILGHSVIFQTINPNINNDKTDEKDEKQDKTLNVLNYVTTKMSHKDIKSKQYKLFWNEKEMEIFGKQIQKQMNEWPDSGELKHDTFIMFISWYGKEGVSMKYIIDSKENEIDFLPIYKEIYFIEGAYLCPTIWCFDAYRCKSDTSEEEDETPIFGSDEWFEWSKKMKKFNGSKYDAYNSANLLANDICYSLSNASQTGGILSQLAKSMFSSKEVAQGKLSLKQIFGRLANKCAQMDVQKAVGSSFVGAVQHFNYMSEAPASKHSPEE